MLFVLCVPALLVLAALLTGAVLSFLDLLFDLVDPYEPYAPIFMPPVLHSSKPAGGTEDARALRGVGAICQRRV